MMRKFKFKSQFIVLTALLVVLSCEKEDLSLESENSASTKSIYDIETISHEKAAINPSLSKTFDEIKAILNPVAKSGTYYDADNDLYIYTDEVKHITVGDYESFTYSIRTKPEDKVIKNLFFSKVSVDEYKSFLITYDISEKSANEIMEHNESGRNPYLDVKEIQTGLTAKIETSSDCIDVETEFICTMEDGTIENYGDSYSGGCTGTMDYVTTISIDLGCVSGGGGGGSTGGGNTGGGDTGGSNPSGDTGGGYPINGGGGGGNTCTNCPPPDSGSNDQEPSDPDDNNDNVNDQPVDCIALDENGECIGDVTVLLPEPIDDEFISFTNEIEFYSQNPCSPENYNCKARIQKMADGLRKFHGLEGSIMADYFESMLDDLDPSNYPDVRAFTITANEITRQFNIQMRDAILGAYVDGVSPIIEIALFEVGGTFAIKLLQKIPLSWVLRGTRLNKVVQKVGLLGVRGTSNTIREYRVTNPASRGSEMFKTITKDKIGQIEFLSPGVRRANMGNGNFITFRDALGSRTGAPATIELNFSEIFAQVRTVKFINL